MSLSLPNWHQEVVDLHQFFQEWFRADLPQTKTAFSRFAQVMHPTFHIVPPSGSLIPREKIVTGLYEGHGQSPHIKIWIEDAQLQYEGEQFLIVTYHEKQENNGEVTDRLSTAVFQPNPDLPNQLSWLHVHETWVT
ncbi:MAG: hypothetical protein AAF490_11580 [Chloroflexota bacterium]